MEINKIIAIPELKGLSLKKTLEKNITLAPISVCVLNIWKKDNEVLLSTLLWCGESCYLHPREYFISR